MRAQNPPPWQQAVVDLDREDSAHLLLSASDPLVKLGKLFLKFSSATITVSSPMALMIGSREEAIMSHWKELPRVMRWGSPGRRGS